EVTDLHGRGERARGTAVGHVVGDAVHRLAQSLSLSLLGGARDRVATRHHGGDENAQKNRSAHEMSRLAFGQRWTLGGTGARLSGRRRDGSRRTGDPGAASSHEPRDPETLLPRLPRR